jgi:fluoroacetyl-CoA thioesterase
MELEIGLKGRRKMVVLKKHLASFTGNLNADVLSTHRVVLLMELSARDAINGRIPEGKITLGTRIDIRHFATAPPGAKVHAEARLKAVLGNRLIFQVAAFHGLEKLAEGENEQIVVSLERFKSRISKKTAFRNS